MIISSCYWVNLVNAWSSGYRADLVIMPTATVNGWVVDITTDQPLDKFEAWKGSVETGGDGQHFSVHSKCYNHLVYNCQCLLIPFLARHSQGVPGVEYRIQFNSQEIEQCDQQPNCDLPEGTSPAPAHSSSTRLDPDFDDISWMVSEDSHTCFYQPCRNPTLCKAPSHVSFTCLCPQLYLTIDNDNATQTNPCEKKDLSLNLAIALSETEIQEVNNLIRAANHTGVTNKKSRRSAGKQDKLNIYSFVSSVHSLASIMKAENVCRLFSELEQLDQAWPDSSLTCSQAKSRYSEIQILLNTFELEDKFSLVMEYRKLASGLGLDTIKATGDLWLSFFIFYSQQWLDLVQCNYNGNKYFTSIGSSLCRYGDCCDEGEVCVNFLGGYQCQPCSDGTINVNNVCQPNTTINTTTINTTISTTINSPNLLPIIAGQETHCPYTGVFASFLCTEWCQTQQLQYGVECS